MSNKLFLIVTYFLSCFLIYGEVQQPYIGIWRLGSDRDNAEYLILTERGVYYQIGRSANATELNVKAFNTLYSSGEWKQTNDIITLETSYSSKKQFGMFRSYPIHIEKPDKLIFWSEKRIKLIRDPKMASKLKEAYNTDGLQWKIVQLELK